MHFLIWLLDEQHYAADLQEINSIVLACDLLPLPNASSEILGAMNVHGKVIPAIDMRHLLGYASKKIEANNHFILAKVNKKELAFLVDRVIGVKFCERESSFSLKGISPEEEVRSIIKYNQHIVYLIHFEKLLLKTTMPEVQ